MKLIIRDECICFIFDRVGVCFRVSHVTPHSARQVFSHTQLFAIMIHELPACSSQTLQVREQHPLHSEIKTQSYKPVSVFQH
jgi:hypothetical protein